MNKKVKNIIIVLIIAILIIGALIIGKLNKNKAENGSKLAKTATNINEISNTKNNNTNNNKTLAQYTLYDFGYEGCYYCAVMEPIFNKYKDSYSNIKFTSINVYGEKWERELSDKFKILYTPTFIVVDNNGREIERKDGAMKEEDFKKFVEQYK